MSHVVPSVNVMSVAEASVPVVVNTVVAAAPIQTVSAPCAASDTFVRVSSISAISLDVLNTQGFVRV